VRIIFILDLLKNSRDMFCKKFGLKIISKDHKINIFGNLRGNYFFAKEKVFSPKEKNIFAEENYFSPKEKYFRPGFRQPGAPANF